MEWQPVIDALRQTARIALLSAVLGGAALAALLTVLLWPRKGDNQP